MPTQLIALLHHVAGVRHRVDGLWAVRKRLDLPPQALNVRLHDGNVARTGVTPHMLNNALRRERVARVQKQQVQDMALRGGQLDVDVLAENLVQPAVEDERAGMIHGPRPRQGDRKSTRLNSSHTVISY